MLVPTQSEFNQLKKEVSTLQEQVRELSTLLKERDVTAREFCDRYGMSIHTFRQKAPKGLFPGAYKLRGGSLWRVKLDEFENRI